MRKINAPRKLAPVHIVYEKKNDKWPFSILLIEPFPINLHRVEIFGHNTHRSARCDNNLKIYQIIKEMRTHSDTQREM